jgi:hypothetical protein
MNEIAPGASITQMNTRGSQSLAQGQVWKTRAAHIEIVALGKNYIHYRISPQLQPRRVSAQISGIEAMANYLKVNSARLAKGAGAN